MGYYDNFLRLCARNQVTPSKVTKDIGLTKSAANRWKNGAIPHDETLTRVAEYFGVTTDELLGIKKAPRQLRRGYNIAARNKSGAVPGKLKKGRRVFKNGGNVAAVLLWFYFFDCETIAHPDFVGKL